MRRIARLLSFVSMSIAVSAFTGQTPALAAWGLDGAVVCNAANTQSGSVAVADGAGGAFVAWVDFRTGTFGHIYAQRLSPQGLPLWTANGVAVSAGVNELDVATASDGAGGAILTWAQADPGDRGFDIYAQRVNASGAVQWTPGGVPICTIHGTPTIPKNKRSPAICPDGSSGAFIAWDDGRAGPSSNDIYAQHVNASGVVQWTTDGVPVCTNASSQTVPVISSGASGNAVVIWYDQRNANQDIFAQRINDPAGSASWTADGVAVCNAAGTQSDLRSVADGAGAYAVWSDERTGAGGYNAYMQRVAAADGAGLWTANGALVCTVGGGIKLRPSIIGSQSGILIAWQDHRSGFADIYAQRFDNTGAQLWTNGGVQMTNLSNHQDFPLATADGAGGAFVACRDLRTDGSTVGIAGHVDVSGALVWPMNGTFTNTTTPTTVKWQVADGVGGAIIGWEGVVGSDVLAQRVVASSNLADYDAVISAVADLPADEGGFVRIAAGGAIGDFAPQTPPVTGYNVWRQIAPVQQSAPIARSADDVAAARDRALATLASAAVPGGRVQLDPLAAESVGFPSGTWESLGFNAARGQTSYAITVATPRDSSSLGSADMTYVLTVHTTLPAIYAVSNTRSGHSVDNLPPGAPQNVGGQITGPSTVQLNWSANLESDLGHYAVYRGASAGFTPGPGNLIGTPTVTTFSDGEFASSYYKISAVDRHGNESAFATLAPENIVGVPRPERATVSFLGAPAPNPFQASMTIRLGMASGGRASLRVFDSGGRLVRTLIDGDIDAGVHPVTWDGRDARGSAAPSGVYLVRLDSRGMHWTRRVTLRQ